MTRFFAAAAVSLLLSAPVLAQPAPVATLTEFHGHVLVNTGDEFRPATKNMALKPGDRVMVQDDSEAELVYSDDCKDEVDENKIYTVSERSKCAGGTPLVQELNPGAGPAIGATGATGTGNGGVLAMVAIVAAIDIWWLNEDDHDVVSP